jgi:hypothetical protein
LEPEPVPTVAAHHAVPGTANAAAIATAISNRIVVLPSVENDVREPLKNLFGAMGRPGI